MADRKKNVSRSQTAELKAQEERKEQSEKATAREERKEQPKQEKPARREAKEPPNLVTRFRSNKFGRFILEAYYELRNKVTWPTFEEARNMTIAVIALSLAIGFILGVADFGLAQLFLLINGGK